MKINHYNDALFKDNMHVRSVLKTLLTAVINDECSRHRFSIKEIRFLDTETKASFDAKKSIQDLLVEIITTENEWIYSGIELQTYKESYSAACVRVKHYKFNLFSRNKLKEGDDYEKVVIPSLMQIWFVRNNSAMFEINPEIYHFCVQGIDSRTGGYNPCLGQDDHYVNVDYFERLSKKQGYIPKNDLEYIMLYLTCKNEEETQQFVEIHKKTYLQDLLNNEKLFLASPEKMGVYMKLEDLERRAEKAEAEKAKAEAEAKAKAEALQKAEAENEALKAKIARLEAEAKAKAKAKANAKA